MPDDAYNLIIEDEDSWSLTLADQGVAVPAPHASTHEAGGDDPITITAAQVEDLGTMAEQDADDVVITGGSITDLSTPLPLDSGGTGAATAPDARANLGLGSLATQDAGSVALTGGNINNTTLNSPTINNGTINSLASPLSITYGGTGANSALSARGSLGLGTLATQAASSVTITGGSIINTSVGATSPSTGAFTTLQATALTLTNALGVTQGGTGASTAANARLALNVPSDDAVVRWLPSITTLTGGGGTALDGIDISNTVDYPTGTSTAVSVSGILYLYRITATGAAESSPSIIRPDSYSGREWTLINMVPSVVAITGGTITGLTTPLPVASGGSAAATLTGILIGNGTSAFTATTSSTVGQTLRVTGANTYAFGALDLADSDAVTGALPLANGGTGATTAATARANLGLVSGTGTLASGTVFVADTSVTATSVIIPIHTTSGSGTKGILDVLITDGVGFDVNSSEGSDSNTFSYFGHY